MQLIKNRIQITLIQLSSLSVYKSSQIVRSRASSPLRDLDTVAYLHVKYENRRLLTTIKRKYFCNPILERVK